MSTILVPIDFSDASRTASLYAASIARKLNSKLILFHAYMIPAPVSEVPYVVMPVDEIQEENEKMVQREAASLKANFDLEIETLVLIGMPSDEIVNLAAERNAALTVIGMRGAGGIDKLIGSTTASVVRKSVIPVLVIPHDFVFTPIEQIIYASDFSYASSPALFAPLLEIGRQYQSKLHVIHVNKSGSKPVTTAEADTKANLVTLLSPLSPTFEILNDDSISHGIKTYIDENRAQLLVMVAHKHNFFDRLFSKIHTTEMVYETKIPLLVLQDKN